ncbi:MAG: phosphatidate cytidylyltransferase [Planctomycetota bacterium]
MSGDAVSPSADRRAKILRRTRVGGTLALIVVLLVWASSFEAGPAITLGLAVVLTLWAIVEVQRMRLFATKYGAPAATVACLAATALFARAFVADEEAARALFDEDGGASRYWAALSVAFAGGAVAGLAAALPSLFGSPERPPDAPTPVPHPLLLAVVALPVLGIVPLRAFGGVAALGCFLALAKVGDIAGYYFGSLLGRRHPFPNLSPGKTVAGCVASFVAGAVVGGLLVALGVLEGARFGVASGIAIGALVNVLAQAGDLAESALKRRANVKDSGTTFGPSGGMLDLIDSLLLSAPVAAFAWPLLFHWPA